MNDITIPTDIQRMIRAHATLQGMTPDQYCNRWWADLRTATAMRGGIEAMEAEIAAIEAARAETTPTTTETTPEEA